jgi:hypothetical protein
MDGIITSYFGYKIGSEDVAQKAAVSACYRRFGRAAKDIMAFALNDPKKARQGVEAIADRMETSGLDWNLDTVARWFPDWMVNPGAFQNETKNKQRFR